MKKSSLSYLPLAALLTACGTGDPNVTPMPGESLFPVAVGNRWTYRVTDNNGISVKVQTITGTIAGVSTFRFYSDTGGKQTVSAQALDGAKLVRVWEKVYDGTRLEEDVRYTPAAMRVDTAYSTLGGSYTTEHLEEHLGPSGEVLADPPPVMKRETFVIEAVDESVSVPAGTFTCVRIRRDSVGGPAKTYWYSRGVGKIKEVGGQTETLVDYILAREGAQ